MTSVRIIGPGRAGRSFAGAFNAVGIDAELLDREASVDDAGRGVDAVLIATPDRSIAEVSTAIRPGAAVVMHCSGATPLTPLAHHARCASIHPLMALPSPQVGADRLLANGWFAIAGDSLAHDLVTALGGRPFVVDDPDRAKYHATAAIAANHLVALLGQVERLASDLGVPVQAFLDLAGGSLDDVGRVGAAAALTGPAARGDTETLDAHRAALPSDERALYEALVAAVQRLSQGT